MANALIFAALFGASVGAFVFTYNQRPGPGSYRPWNLPRDGWIVEAESSRSGDLPFSSHLAVPPGTPPEYVAAAAYGMACESMGTFAVSSACCQPPNRDGTYYYPYKGWSAHGVFAKRWVDHANDLKKYAHDLSTAEEPFPPPSPPDR